MLVVGVVLMIFGMNASASVGSRLSELFTGAPSDRTIWLLVVGVAAIIIGLGMVLVPEFEDHSTHIVEPHRKSKCYTMVVRHVYLVTGCKFCWWA